MTAGYPSRSVLIRLQEVPATQREARPMATFPATEHHRPSIATKLYCLATEAHTGTTSRPLDSFLTITPRLKNIHYWYEHVNHACYQSGASSSPSSFPSSCSDHGPVVDISHGVWHFPFVCQSPLHSHPSLAQSEIWPLGVWQSLAVVQ